ncbi:MAG: sigma-70 family RNA polymerase sigma factor [Planctomycetes bacterium]|nr:sigma-70 family RNA polymerase sigma factor [Planctomycetota bacterium]
MEDATQDVLARARVGDRAAIEQLITAELDHLRAFLRVRAGSALRAHEASVDLVQSVCREALADLAHFEFRGEAEFRRWLFLHAERKLADRGRFWARDKRDPRHERRGQTTDGDMSAALEHWDRTLSSPSEDAVARESLERILAGFKQLPPDQRAVLIQSRFMRASTADIARARGCTAAYVRTLLSRAIARLGRELSQ